MENKINIWQLLSNYPQSDINCSTHRNGGGDTVMGMEEIKESMIEFAKQVLKLAAENAEIIKRNTFDGDAHYYIINKQSILDTINQIE